MGLAYPLQIFLGIIAIVVVIALIVLFRRFNKSLQKKAEIEDKKYKDFKARIEEIKKSKESTEKRFKLFNSIVREFFKEYFDLGYTLTYLQLKSKFDSIEKKNYSKFCKLMTALDYSGASIKNRELVGLIDFFLKIIDQRN